MMRGCAATLEVMGAGVPSCLDALNFTSTSLEAGGRTVAYSLVGFEDSALHSLYPSLGRYAMPYRQSIIIPCRLPRPSHVLGMTTAKCIRKMHSRQCIEQMYALSIYMHIVTHFPVLPFGRHRRTQVRSRPECRRSQR